MSVNLGSSNFSILCYNTDPFPRKLEYFVSPQSLGESVPLQFRPQQMTPLKCVSTHSLVKGTCELRDYTGSSKLCFKTDPFHVSKWHTIFPDKFGGITNPLILECARTTEEFGFSDTDVFISFRKESLSAMEKLYEFLPHKKKKKEKKTHTHAPSR